MKNYCYKCDGILGVGEIMENRIIIEKQERTFCNKCYQKIKDKIFKVKKDGTNKRSRNSK